jgi:hypothetical protein
MCNSGCRYQIYRLVGCLVSLHELKKQCEVTRYRSGGRRPTSLLDWLLFVRSWQAVVSGASDVEAVVHQRRGMQVTACAPGGKRTAGACQ